MAFQLEAANVLNVLNSALQERRGERKLFREALPTQITTHKIVTHTNKRLIDATASPCTGLVSGISLFSLGFSNSLLTCSGE